VMRRPRKMVLCDIGGVVFILLILLDGFDLKILSRWSISVFYMKMR